MWPSQIHQPPSTTAEALAFNILTPCILHLSLSCVHHHLYLFSSSRHLLANWEGSVIMSLGMRHHALRPNCSNHRHARLHFHMAKNLFWTLLILFGDHDVSQATFLPAEFFFATCHPPSLVRDKIHIGKQDPPTHSIWAPSLIFLRGGASESASAWSAGSKYEHRTSPNFSAKSPTRSFESPSFKQRQDGAKAATKEAFAEAFRRREDRNRFIGKWRYRVSFFFVLLYGAGSFFHTWLKYVFVRFYNIFIS